MTKRERVEKELKEAKEAMAWHKEQMEYHEQIVLILEDAKAACELLDTAHV